MEGVEFDFKSPQIMNVILSEPKKKSWRKKGRDQLLTAIVRLVDQEDLKKVVVQTQSGVVLASLPVGRNLYSKRLPLSLAINLVELDEPLARLIAWRYLSAGSTEKNRIKCHYQDPDVVDRIKRGILSEHELDRMFAGEVNPFDCPVCGEAAETRLVRNKITGVMVQIMTCESGHETRVPLE